MASLYDRGDRCCLAGMISSFMINRYTFLCDTVVHVWC
jgi:hypothetical protein